MDIKQVPYLLLLIIFVAIAFGFVVVARVVVTHLSSC